MATSWTDEAGRAVLGFDPTMPVEIIAEGYRSYRTDAFPVKSPMRVVLEPGASLTVAVENEGASAEARGQLSLRMSFDRSPFDSAIAAGHPEARSFSPALYLGFQRHYGMSWSYDSRDPDAAGALIFASIGHVPLVIPGLVPGAELRVELVDPVGAILSSRRVVAETTGTSVIFDVSQLDVTTLVLDPHWADGSPIKRGGVRVRGRGEGSKAFYLSLPADKLVLGPMAPGVVDITTEVPGAKNVKGLAVHVGETGLRRPVVLELER